MAKRTLQLYPAIDIYEGKVVRLTKGDYARSKVYSSSPAEMAKDWEAQGAQWIHVVDLEGAKGGELYNLGSLLEIRKAVRCSIQFGGGVRTLEDLRKLKEAGIDRVVLGTKALDQNFLTLAVSEFKNSVAVGLDVRAGKVQAEGWLKEGSSADDLLKVLNAFSFGALVYTNIQKDGMLQGPDLEGLKKILQKARAKVILSGGISSLEDIKKASEVSADNFEGMIIGKALYEKYFTLRQALSALKGGL